MGMREGGGSSDAIKGVGICGPPCESASMSVLAMSRCGAARQLICLRLCV